MNDNIPRREPLFTTSAPRPLRPPIITPRPQLDGTSERSITMKALLIGGAVMAFAVFGLPMLSEGEGSMCGAAQSLFLQHVASQNHSDQQTNPASALVLGTLGVIPWMQQFVAIQYPAWPASLACTGMFWGIKSGLLQTTAAPAVGL